VIFVVDTRRSTLLDYKYRQHLTGEKGQKGQGARKTGRRGQDLLVPVPLGTLVYEEGDPEPLADLATPEARYVVAKGGRGGRGNASFATPTNQAPRHAEPGTPGQERTIRLVLKLLADVGLVGLPNAGKSTLISRISAARPKIADYPFTTLQPHLGVVELPSALRGERTLVVADLPGLIEGAHEGAGLGIRFLRHIERTRCLLFVIAAAPDVGPAEGEAPEAGPLAAFDLLADELRQFRPDLLDRPRVVALNKTDLPWAAAESERVVQAFASRQLPAIPISGLTGQGIPALLEMLWQRVKESPDVTPNAPVAPPATSSGPGPAAP
jgi:GTP-binding protein